MNIPFTFKPDDQILATGQPSASDFAALKNNGYSTIINLRSEGEMMGINEARMVEENGMDYIHFPIAGATGITVENARKLDAMIKDARAGKIVIHCASSNRVGALLALRAFHCEGKSASEAINYGRDAGLAGLIGHVQTLL